MNFIHMDFIGSWVIDMQNAIDYGSKKGLLEQAGWNHADQDDES